MKIPDSELQYVSLHGDLDLSFFECENSDYDDFLKNDALEDQNNRYSVTRVTFYKEHPVGYFTLMTDIIEKREIPRRQQPPYEYREYPAIKVARLATHVKFQRMNIGTAMMRRAFAITIKLSSHVGCRFITVEAEPESIGFYEQLSFQRAKSDPTPSGSIPMYIDFHRALNDHSTTFANFI